MLFIAVVAYHKYSTNNVLFFLDWMCNIYLVTKKKEIMLANLV